MARKVCDYCGTEYENRLPRCPLCGSVNEELSGGEGAFEDDEALLQQPPARRTAQRQPAADDDEPAPRKRRTYVPPVEDEDEDAPVVRTRRRGGARVAPKEDMIPKWISVLICMFLGLAVLIGAVFALYSLGIFTPKQTPEDKDSSLVLPIEPEDAQPEDVKNPEIEPDEPSEIPCTGIALSDTAVSLTTANPTRTLTAMREPENSTQIVVWSSEDENVCAVEDGQIKAVGTGKTNVVVTCGNFTAKCAVTVAIDTNEEPALEPPVGNASLNLEDFTLFKVGETAKISVKDAPSGASVSWSSSDSAVATVSSDGTVTAVKTGTATVTAEIGGQKLKCIVRCNIKGMVDANENNVEVVGGSALSHSDVTLNSGESFRLSVVDSTSSHGWSVSSGAVCSVDGDGKVTALGTGTATISTTVGGETLKCIVRVK